MASSSKLSSGTVARIFNVSKHEKAGDAKGEWILKEALKLAVNKVDMSKWRKVNSVACGIDRSMIPLPSRIVLNVLRDKGYQCFLVGGCVRDLLLKRVPKDFDVITTANLKQIKNEFRQSHIVGQRFPVCLVNIRGQEIEVSSFDTVANKGSVNKSSPRLMPKSCTKTDVLLWRNSMHRDFTVNSLFFDPYSARIYDYTGGMMDLKSLELRTLVPAHLSFQEDCARILRGLRIAARLNLSLSHDTAAAIHRLSPSVLTLSKFRIMMELNYMLSYGAAQPSLSLLERFRLLHVFFPCQAAILDQQTNKGCSLSSTMLMRLFSSLDNILACDRPGHCSIWISLLAFHLALNTKPQEPLVVWAFSSLLCSKNWSKSAKFARESAGRPLFSAPEISKSLDQIDDIELANKVSELASLVATSIESLTRKDALVESISRFRRAPTSVMIFVPEKCGKDTTRLFSMFDADIKLYTEGRKRVEIDYQSLKKGEVLETRYVLGRVIMDTMSGKVNEACSNEDEETFYESTSYKKELVDHNLHLYPSADEKNKFGEISLEAVDRIPEGVEIKNGNNFQHDLEDYFLEELGPARFQEKSEEPTKVARKCPKENISKQKASGIPDHETKHVSEEKAFNPSQKIVAGKIVKQKMLHAKQVIETLQLQSEIKFSGDKLKKDEQTTSQMFRTRQETHDKDGRDTKQMTSETNFRKPLSSLFKSTSMENNTSRKVTQTFDRSDQIQGLMATDEKKTCESSKKNVDPNISETLEHVRCLSTEEMGSIQKAGQTKTNENENLSEKLHHETEPLIVGGKYHKAMKKQEVMITLSQVIREKSAKENSSRTDKTGEVINGNNHPPSGSVPDKATIKRKRNKTRSKSQEKTETVLTIKNSDTVELDVESDIQEARVNTRHLKTEEDEEALITGQRKTTVTKKLCENIELKTKTRRRSSQKLANLANSSEEIKETFAEGTTCAHIGNGKEVTDTSLHCPLADNIQPQKPAIKKRKSSKKPSEPKNEMKTGAKINHNKAPEQNLDADIMEALDDGEDLIGTTKTGVGKTATKPKKRSKAVQKQQAINISSEAICGDQVQDQTSTKKKKSSKARLKMKDKVNVQTLQLKTAMRFDEDDFHADTNGGHPPSPGHTSSTSNADMDAPNS